MNQDSGPRSVLNVQKVDREGLYEKVVQQLQDLIVAQHLRRGDRLPGERELCEQFGVSRTVIREATKVLAQRGMLTIEPGRGTFVTLPTEESIASSIDLFARAHRLAFGKLIEVRRALEPEIAGLAARRASPEHLGRLRESVAAMDRSYDDPDAFIAGDQGFHNILAEASGNDLLLALSGVVIDLCRISRRLTVKVANSPQRGQHYHRLILDRVMAGDAAGARTAMADHIAQVEEDTLVVEQSLTEAEAPAAGPARQVR